MSGTLRPWRPVVAWAAVILALTLMPVRSPPEAEAVPHADKLVHVGLYLGLGWFAARALWTEGWATGPGILACVAAGLAFGALNEALQALVPLRQPSAADWLADAAGVTFGVAGGTWRRTRGKGAARTEREAGG